jgi:hypothetical protein
MKGRERRDHRTALHCTRTVSSMGPRLMSYRFAASWWWRRPSLPINFSGLVQNTRPGTPSDAGAPAQPRNARRKQIQPLAFLDETVAQAQHPNPATRVQKKNNCQCFRQLWLFRNIPSHEAAVTAFAVDHVARGGMHCAAPPLHSIYSSQTGFTHAASLWSAD